MKTTQTILALETSTSVCSVALWNGRQIFQKTATERFSQSQKILQMTNQVLQEGQINIADIDFIACARGPGSFTGLRIGVGVAKGLAYGQDIPIIPISPLQAVAYQAIIREKIDSITVIQDARMGEVYAAQFRVKNSLPVLVGPEYLAKIEDIVLENQCFAGTATVEYKATLLQRGAVLSPAIFPRASDILHLSQQSGAHPVSATDFRPVYIRDKVAS